jgi:3-oxoacyl-[acyl-carrier protein] reductase
MNRLKELSAIITGAGSGFGAATARAFVAEGARVVLADVNLDGAREVAGELGDAAVAVQADVRDSESVAAMVATADERFSGLDILVNNAGLAHKTGPITELTEDQYNLVMDVNVKGTWLGVKHAVPLLCRRGGVILNLSSAGALTPRPNAGVYYASKAAVLNMTKALSIELAPLIRVNCVCPSLAPTNFLTGASGSADVARARIAAGLPTAGIPLDRVCEPGDVAAALVYLASPEAAYVTGVALPVDGGMSAGLTPLRQ